MLTALNREAAPEPSLAHTLLVCALTAVAVFAAYTLIWAARINHLYFPYGDSFSLLVNSCPPFHPSIAAWFRTGFATYFNVYPDLSVHSTNFIRPVVNATFYGEWFLYHDHWSRYLLTTYAVIALLAAATLFIARRTLRLSLALSLFAALAVTVAPSIDSGALLDPTFAFDLLTGLFLLLATLAVITDALVAAWLLIAVAVFTKDAALFAPVLVALILLIEPTSRSRLARFALSFAFLLPLLAWLGLRWFDFRGDEGIYVFINHSRHGPLYAALLRFASGMLTWPLATAVYWNQHLLLLRLLVQLSRAYNVLFWITIAVALLRGARAIARPETVVPHRHTLELDADRAHAYATLAASAFARFRALLGTPGPARAVTIFVLFSIGSLLMPVTLNLARRFGGAFYPCFLLSLAAAAHIAPRRPARLAALAAMLAITLSGALLIVISLGYHTPLLAQTWAASRDYVDLLAHSREPVLLSANDLSGGYSSNPYVARFAGYTGELIRLNDLEWDTRCHAALKAISSPASPGRPATLSTAVPSGCGELVFNSIFPPLPPATTHIERNLLSVHLGYVLKQEDRSAAPDRPVTQMQITLEPKRPGSALLLSDPTTGRYRKFQLSP